MQRMLTAFGLVVVLLASCSSEGKVGESCGTSGKVDGECEAGAVCGADTTGALKCLKQCTDQSQCATGEDCNGVSGTSLKGCRPKTK